MDPKEKLEGAETREDAARKDNEEMPVWAADMMKKVDSLHGRMDAMEKGDRKDSEAEAKEEERQAGELEKIAKEERAEGKKEAREDRKDSKREDSEKKEDCRMDESKEEEHKAGEELAKAREDAARADAAAQVRSRELEGKIKAMQSQIDGLFREPSYEDRNALAEARARADAAYQAVSGRPASDPMPGESPISYRKRMADGLRKFSAKFKEERVDSLSGSAFEIVEQQIYADAAVAAKKPENLPPGQLRGVTRNDSGHMVTDYTGDPKAAWRNFSTGAVLGIALKNPARAA